MQPEGNRGTDAVERLQRAGAGDRQVLAELFGEHREGLTRLVSRHMHAALRSRVDPADVLQDAYLQASAELPRYLRGPKMPLAVWLRTIVLQKLRELHRHHLGVQARDASRQVSLHGDPVPQAGAPLRDARLPAEVPSPGDAVLRAETRARVREALDWLEPHDREVLTLRHFDQLSNREAAAALGISEKAASNRHVRALLRLKGMLAEAGVE